MPPTFLRVPSARTLTIPTRKPRRVALRKPRRVPILLEDGRVACCLQCALRAEAVRRKLRARRRRPQPPGLWLGMAGRLVLLAIYCAYVSAVFTPLLDLPREVPAEEYDPGP